MLSGGHHSSFFENGNLTPTVELNALAMKRGEPAVYLAETTTIPPPHQLNNSILNAPINNGHGVNSSLQQQQPPPQHLHPVNPHQMQQPVHQQGGASQQPNQFIPHQLNQYSNFHRNSNNNSSNNSNVYQRFNNNYERRGMARSTYGKYDYQV